MKKLSLLSLTLVVVLASCGKYEDGPSFSLISKKARVANTWTLSAILDADGTDLTAEYDAMFPDGWSWIVELGKDGTSSATFSYTYSGVTYTDTETGTWAFSDDKMQLLMTDSAGTDTDTSNILKLESDEMWLQDPSDSTETHMITKED